MATSQFEVDTDYLRNSITDIRQHLQTLKNAQNRLESKMAEIGGMWEGPARDVFHQQFRADSEKLLELCEQIEEALNSMDSAAKEYDNCDADVRSMINAMKL